MKIVSKYFRKRKETINKILNKPRHKYYPGTFHKLRVEVKKLNALFELTNFCAKDFKEKKTFHPFKELFDQAGKVREVQVEEAILRSYRTNSLKDFKNELREKRISEQNNFFKRSTKKFHLHLNDKLKIIDSFFSEIDNKKTNKFIDKKKKEITKLLQERTSRTMQLHELRKQLKTLSYISEHLSEKRSKLKTQYDSLSKHLGKWHDCEVILEHFSRVLKSESVNSKTKSKLRDIKSVIKADYTNLYKRINTKIEQLEFN
jgi:CHAD domain-containing protein